MAIMVPRTRKVFLGDRADVLGDNAVDSSPASQGFKIVGSISALVKGETTNNDDSMDLFESSSSILKTLQGAIKGQNTSDVIESERAAMEDLGKVMRELEGVLRIEASPSSTKYRKTRVGGNTLEPRRPPGTPSVLSPHSHENLSVRDRVRRSTPADPHNATTTSTPESACSRLVRNAHAPHELSSSSLIEAILSSKDKGETVRGLPVEDAQVFINVMDKALDAPRLTLLARRKCLRLLYRTCGHHALLPSALMVSAHYDRARNPPCKGGYADVWKGEYRGQAVAVKVLRTYSNRELQKIINRFCKEVVTWSFLRHPNVLPLIGVMMSENQFAMVSDWMANGDINEFIERHPGADRLRLLAGVAKGLIYLHTSGMVHGDLKGANILIDETGNARLADFGLLTIISDPANRLSSSSNTQGGTVRWMSPELLTPERFGLKKSRPTRSSDCYALGMVIYETISGNVPFHEHADLVVFVKVMAGEHPARGEEFTDDLWKTLESCWEPRPNARPTIEDVLRCLEVSPSVSGGDIETRRNTSTSPDWIYLAHDKLAAAQSTCPPSTIPATRGTGADTLDYEEIDVDPFTLLEAVEEAERSASREQPPVLHHRPNTKESPPRGGPASANRSSEWDIAHTVHTTQEDFGHVTIHPDQDVIAEFWCNSTIQGDSRMSVPEYPHRCSSIQEGWERKPPICFSTWFKIGVRLLDALRGNLDGIDDKDALPFDESCGVITIRIRFPGYASSTAVGGRLKEQRKRDGRAAARSMQVTMKSRERNDFPRSITKKELVKGISKCVRRYIRDVEENEDLFPFDRGVSEKWRLGQERMRLKHMVITRLDNVCPGCWCPVIHVE